MSTITINGYDLELDLFDIDTMERVEAAQEKYTQRLTAGEKEAKGISGVYRIARDAVIECMDSIFGVGTSHRLFANSGNMKLYFDAMSTLKRHVEEQPAMLESSYLPGGGE